MTVKEQIKAAFGTTGLFMLINVLRQVKISIDSKNQLLTFRRYGKATVTISFADFEDFVNGI